MLSLHEEIRRIALAMTEREASLVMVTKNVEDLWAKSGKVAQKFIEAIKDWVERIKHRKDLLGDAARAISKVTKGEVFLTPEAELQIAKKES